MTQIILRSEGGYVAGAIVTGGGLVGVYQRFEYAEDRKPEHAWTNRVLRNNIQTNVITMEVRK